ncbi:hypothetical protein EVAR_40745_1 [Eumeta japonica]|uniref:Uncharacterized protein n=1 Tax=Eumeta variegata TaxID=151549 RepID=A0A4C1X514_EUMVA|nr:hypothetical protein EVAR_40745_1 [Eumeta japonica]
MWGGVAVIKKNSTASPYREPHRTDGVFGRRRRRMSVNQIVSQISVTTFELVKHTYEEWQGLELHRERPNELCHNFPISLYDNESHRE